MLFKDLVLYSVKIDLQRKLDVCLSCHEFQCATLLLVCVSRKPVELWSQDMSLDEIVEVLYRVQLLELP